MPAYRLEPDSRKRVSQYAVVGEYSTDKDGFVTHLALLRDESELQYASKARVWHMKPPLVVPGVEQRITEEDTLCDAHLIGSIDLDANRRDNIRHWLAQLKTQGRPDFSPRQYIVDPPSKWEERNGRKLYRRFSCCGFVLACYEEAAKISLLDDSRERFPPVCLDAICRVYGENLREERKTRLREWLGIGGAGPWRVLLPSYVFHALNRSLQRIHSEKYIPSEREQRFP